MTPYILNLGARWRSVVIFYYAAELGTSSSVHWVGSETPSVDCEERTELFPRLQSENRFLRCPALNLDTILNELSRR